MVEDSAEGVRLSLVSIRKPTGRQAEHNRLREVLRQIFGVSSSLLAADREPLRQPNT